MTSSLTMGQIICSRPIKGAVLLTTLSFVLGAAQDWTAKTRGSVTVLDVPISRANDSAIDFVNAKAKDLPLAPGIGADAQQELMNALASRQSLGSPGYAAGGGGDGATHPVSLGAPAVEANAFAEVEPQEFGTYNHPFSTARVNLLPTYADTAYPYRASGKLFFNIGASTYVCSASLIKRGVVVTAAHCVANFGRRQFYSNWRFVPAYRSGIAPYGVWSARTAIVLTSYYAGTDACAVAGIVCQDDVAVILLNSSAIGAYPGTSTGWYGYGWNGFGFTASAITEISQLGYPVCLDNGALMERNDSYGYRSAANSNNTIIGSLMCGGSSGGPWLVNLGIRPALTGTTSGSAPNPNIVVGVTSWGYTSTAPKEQGASPFTSGNITVLVSAACVGGPFAACN